MLLENDVIPAENFKKFERDYKILKSSKFVVCKGIIDNIS